MNSTQSIMLGFAHFGGHSGGAYALALVLFLIGALLIASCFHKDTEKKQ
jgi:hypothetical protein